MATNNWKKREGLVYSTNPDAQYDYGDEEQVTLPPSEQRLRIELDKKQRAGKQVTLITGFVGSDDDLKDLAKKLKQSCGIGGSAKDGEIVLHGDFRDKVTDLLNSLGFKTNTIR